MAAGTASADDLRWKLEGNLEGSSVYDPGFAGAVWHNKSACDGDGALQFRQIRSGGRWSAAQTLTTCSDARIGEPALVRDSGNRQLFVIWSQVEILNRKRSGIYFRRSTNGGKTWSKAKITVRTPDQISPSHVTGAARAGRLWLMYTAPQSLVDRRPPFKVEAYRPSDGRLMIENLAVGAGHYRVSPSGGTMQLYGAKLGLLAVWKLEDAAGKSRWYAADTNYVKQGRRNRMQFVFRGQQDVGTTMFKVGEDRRPYRFTQITPPPIRDAMSRFEISRWSFTKHQYVNTYNPVLVPYNLKFGDAALTFNVGRDRAAYIMYRSFEPRDDIELVAAQPATRSVAPEPGKSSNFILRLDVKGGATRAPIPWPFGRLAPAGADVLQWVLPGTGLEGITGQFGGVRFVGRLGHQDIGAQGDVTADAEFVMAISNPVAFEPYDGSKVASR
jgi:hypothetical protein